MPQNVTLGRIRRDDCERLPGLQRIGFAEVAIYAALRPPPIPTVAKGWTMLDDGTLPATLDNRPNHHGLLRRCLRSFIHFFSYHLILSRRHTQVTRVGGFDLNVRPTVFHPRFFLSSQRFISFLDGLDLRGKVVIDVGTGSGVIALAAARAGAETVIAADINPNAAICAAENARTNDLGDRVHGVASNLLSAFAPRPMFDVILSSPPKHAGEPRDLADRGWHAGPAYRDVANLFDQAKDRLKPGGKVYVMLSSDSDIGLFEERIRQAGFNSRIAKEYSIWIESFILYELTVR
jgi:methylase of polypeptide subunit release factors